MNLRRIVVPLIVNLSCYACAASTEISCSSPAAAPGSAVEYFVSIADHDRHLLHVAIRYYGNEATTFQLPVWNALYQVRDFAQFVSEVEARDNRNQPLRLSVADKSTWQVDPADGCAVLQYSMYADTAGPFSAQANAEHVFLNWAQVLLYAPAKRAMPVMLVVSGVPAPWSLHDLGLFDESPHDGAYRLSQPATYDALADSPVEMGRTQSSVFESDGARLRIVVDSDTADFGFPALQEAVKKVVRAEIEWMHDRPFQQYTILYHFPTAAVGGGMEHAFGTAITVPASRVNGNALAPIATTAHEIFHLWNVKRIRPRSMEPVDFQHEQYSRALWFCEGVTSTAAELMLVRAGLKDEPAYLEHLGELISGFQSRPARHFQSAEASSVEAWMEGRSYYRRPERSVSYYVSGELIGVLLDLRIRQATNGKKSLRDLFQWMNTHYAKQGLYYDDARGIQQAAEEVSGQSMESFFERFVRGTDEIPFDEFFSVVGLKSQSFAVPAPDAGFDASVNFTGLPEVIAITSGSAVETAGIRVGDKLAAIDDREYLGDLGAYLANRKAGDVLSFSFISAGGNLKTVKVTLKAAEAVAYSLVDLPEVTPAQRAQRSAWIRGDDLPGGKH